MQKKPIRRKVSVDDRTGWLGGSSWGAALGLSVFKTPHDVYLDFKGVKREATEQQQIAFEMGHALEPVVARIAERRYSMKLKSSPFLWVSPHDRRLGCHPDRLSEDGRIGVEIKTSSAYDSARWGREDTDEIPYDYLVQCYSYFECCDVEKVWLIRFSNNRPTRYIIERPDENTLSEIVTALSEWMDKVESGWVPAPVDYAEASSMNFGQREGEIKADDELMLAREEYDSIKAEMSSLDKRLDAVKVRVVTKLGKAGKAVDENGKTVFSYQLQERKSLDKDRLKEEHPEIDLDGYMKKSASMVLR